MDYKNARCWEYLKGGYSTLTEPPIQAMRQCRKGKYWKDHKFARESRTPAMHGEQQPPCSWITSRVLRIKPRRCFEKKKSSRVLRKEQGNLLWSDYRPTRLVVSRGVSGCHNKVPPSAERSLHSTNRRRTGRVLYITRRVKKEKIKDDALESLVVVWPITSISPNSRSYGINSNFVSPFKLTYCMFSDVKEMYY